METVADRAPRNGGARPGHPPVTRDKVVKALRELGRASIDEIAAHTGLTRDRVKGSIVESRRLFRVVGHAPPKRNHCKPYVYELAP